MLRYPTMMCVMLPRYMDLRNRHITTVTALLFCFLYCHALPQRKDLNSPRTEQKAQKQQSKALLHKDTVRKWQKMQKRTPPTSREIEKWDEDKNHRFEYLSDEDFNASPRGCYMVNGIYIGPYDIGIDTYSMEKEELNRAEDYPIRDIGKDKDSLILDVPLSMWTEQEHGWPSIRGKEIAVIYNYKCQRNGMQLVSLDDIRQEHFPDTDTPIVYIVNKFIITRDEDLYKIDKNFIHKVEILHSEQIDALRAFPPFCILRIFTRTAHNWHQGIVGVY